MLEKEISLKKRADVPVQLVEMVDNSLFLERFGANTTIEIDVGGGWGTSYERGFVEKVSKGDFTMTDLIKHGSTPLTEPSAWPVDHSATLNLLLSVVHPSTNIVLTKNPGELKEILNLENQALVGFEERYKWYYDSLSSFEIKNKSLHAVKWGLLAANAYRFLEKDDETVTFSIPIATRVPHLIYEVEFRGNIRTDRGGITQKLRILPYKAIVTNGWEEWYTEISKNLLEAK